MKVSWRTTSSCRRGRFWWTVAWSRDCLNPVTFCGWCEHTDQWPGYTRGNACQKQIKCWDLILESWTREWTAAQYHRILTYYLVSNILNRTNPQPIPNIWSERWPNNPGLPIATERGHELIHGIPCYALNKTGGFFQYVLGFALLQIPDDGGIIHRAGYDPRTVRTPAQIVNVFQMAAVKREEKCGQKWLDGGTGEKRNFEFGIGTGLSSLNFLGT